MANLRRSKHEADRGGGRGSKSNVVRCKKHPKHRQSPGVCSLCLRERLCQLSTNSWSRATISTTARSLDCSTSSSLSSYYSSCSSSSCSTPVASSYRSMTRGMGNSLSMSFVVSANNVLKKSRSLAFVPRTSRRPRDGGGVDDPEKKKKGGFWSKLLLRPTSKRMEETAFMHSRTVRESNQGAII